MKTLRKGTTTELPKDRYPTQDEVTLALTQRGEAPWIEKDLKRLLYNLACAGYGWMGSDGVKRKLEKMAADRNGLPALHGG